MAAHLENRNSDYRRCWWTPDADRKKCDLATEAACPHAPYDACQFGQHWHGNDRINLTWQNRPAKSDRPSRPGPRAVAIPPLAVLRLVKCAGCAKSLKIVMPEELTADRCYCPTCGTTTEISTGKRSHSVFDIVDEFAFCKRRAKK